MKALVVAWAMSAAVAVAAEPPLRISAGGFKSSTPKFPVKSLLTPLTAELETLAAQKELTGQAGFVWVRDATASADVSVSANIVSRGAKFDLTLTVANIADPRRNVQLVYSVTNPRIGSKAAKLMAGDVWVAASQLASSKPKAPPTESPVVSAEPPPPPAEEIPEAEPEPDPFFRPAIRGFVRALGVATWLDKKAALYGIVGLKSSPRALFEANLQPQLKTRGDYFSLNADLSLYGATTAPTGLMLFNELYADARYGPVRLLVGRRRVVWGSGLALNPTTDLLNPPKDPLTPDLQRTGALMLPMVDVTVGPFIITGLVSMGLETDSWAVPTALKPENSVYGLRLYALWEGIDLNVVYYRNQARKQNLVGFAGSRFLGDWVEVHAEGLLRGGAPDMIELPAIPGCGEPLKKLPGSVTLTALAGARIHFADSSRIVAEYMYDGNGLDSSRYEQLADQAPCVAMVIAQLGGPTPPPAPQQPLGFPAEQLFLVRAHHVFINYERPHLNTGVLEDVSLSAGIVASPLDLSAILQAGIGYSFGGRAILNARIMYWAGKRGEIGDWPARVLGMASIKVAF